MSERHTTSVEQQMPLLVQSVHDVVRDCVSRFPFSENDIHKYLNIWRNTHGSIMPRCRLTPSLSLTFTIVVYMLL